MNEHIASRATTWDKIEVLEEHAHSASKCYPTLAGGVTVTGAAGAQTLGAFQEIVPANTITDDFDIHYLNIEDASADDQYELVLYAVTTEIARVRFIVDTSVFGGGLPALPVQSDIIPKNTQIQAKLATAGGGSDTATISLHYHTY
jgi:hypothetical protein